MFKTVFNNIVGGFTEEVNVGQEDYEFHATLALKGYKLQPIPQTLLYYRMHNGEQMIRQTSRVRVTSIIKI